MTPEERKRVDKIRGSAQEWRKTDYELGDVIAGLESDSDFLLSLVDRLEASSSVTELESLTLTPETKNNP